MLYRQPPRKPHLQGASHSDGKHGDGSLSPQVEETAEDDVFTSDDRRWKRSLVGGAREGAGYVTGGSPGLGGAQESEAAARVEPSASSSYRLLARRQAAPEAPATTTAAAIVESPQAPKYRTGNAARDARVATEEVDDGSWVNGVSDWLGVDISANPLPVDRRQHGDSMGAVTLDTSNVLEHIAGYDDVGAMVEAFQGRYELASLGDKSAWFARALSRLEVMWVELSIPHRSVAVCLITAATALFCLCQALMLLQLQLLLVFDACSLLCLLQ